MDSSVLAMLVGSDCHVALVELVAVNVWPAIGAAAELTTTVVVSLFSEKAAG